MTDDSLIVFDSAHIIEPLELPLCFAPGPIPFFFALALENILSFFTCLRIQINMKILLRR